MVGFTKPCPSCGNKRRRPFLDRWDSCPIPVPTPPPPAKFARSASDPTPSAVAAAVQAAENTEIRAPALVPTSTQLPPPTPPTLEASISLGRPILDPTVETTTGAANLSPAQLLPPISPTGDTIAATTSPSSAQISPSFPLPAEIIAGSTNPSPAQIPPSITPARELNDKKESEKKEKKAKRKATEAEISRQGEIKICFKCTCGNSEEVFLTL